MGFVEDAIVTDTNGNISRHRINIIETSEFIHYLLHQLGISEITPYIYTMT